MVKKIYTINSLISLDFKKWNTLDKVFPYKSLQLYPKHIEDNINGFTKEIIYYIDEEKKIKGIKENYEDVTDENNKLIGIKETKYWAFYIQGKNETNADFDLENKETKLERIKYYTRKQIEGILRSRRDNISDFLLEQAKKNPQTEFAYGLITDEFQKEISTWRMSGDAYAFHDCIDRYMVREFNTGEQKNDNPEWIIFQSLHAPSVANPNEKIGTYLKKYIRTINL